VFNPGDPEDVQETGSLAGNQFSPRDALLLPADEFWRDIKRFFADVDPSDFLTERQFSRR
jgi:hypothetical protein